MGDFYVLDAELNGRVDNKTGEKVTTGLLGEKISLIAKYWLTQLSNTVRPEVDFLNQQRTDLIRKYGKEDDQGSITVSPVIEVEEGGVSIQKMNPAFFEFNKEFTELLSQEKEVSYTPIKLSDLSSVETSENYSTVFLFVEA